MKKILNSGVLTSFQKNRGIWIIHTQIREAARTTVEITPIEFKDYFISGNDKTIIITYSFLYLYLHVRFLCSLFPLLVAI
jgi:hypothetical protein